MRHKSDFLDRETFENIYLDLSKQSGRCRFAESGLGWKPSGGSEPFTLDSNQVGAAQWSRASKGYEIKIITRDAQVIQLDGFDQEDFDRAAKAFKIWYGINLETKEHALRGWHWGKAELGRAELAFSVQNRPAFEIPYSETLAKSLHKTVRTDTRRATPRIVAVRLQLLEMSSSRCASTFPAQSQRRK